MKPTKLAVFLKTISSLWSPKSTVHSFPIKTPQEEYKSDYLLLSLASAVGSHNWADRDNQPVSDSPFHHL